MLNRLTTLSLTFLIAVSAYCIQDPRVAKAMRALEQTLGQKEHSIQLVVSSSTRTSSGAEVIYGYQTLEGLEIVHSNFNAIFKGESLVKLNHRFYADASSLKSQLPLELDLFEALQIGAGDLPLDPSSYRDINDYTAEYKDATLSDETVIIERKWLMVDGELQAIAEFHIHALDHQESIEYRISLHTGTILESRDLILKCSFHPEAHPKSQSPQPEVAEATHAMQSDATSSYEVFPFPIESPNHGDRAVVSDPDDSLASPYGWHDVNGQAGAEYTITRGNNVFAGDDKDNDNIPENSPDGGSSLTFTADFDKTKSAALYTDASVINLFYWTNLMHDVWYHYGFDEVSGNFQANNYGRGGSAGDALSAQAQDGSGTNNANFYTSGGDGSPAQIQMFIWNSAGGGSSDYIQVNSPASAEGKYVSNRAVFGAQLSTTPVTADLVVAESLRACNPLTNSSAVNGKIALIQRGGCTFVEKVRNAEAAGAIGVVIYDSTAGNPILMGGTASDIQIPAVMIRNNDGLFLKNLASSGVNVSLYDSSNSGSSVFDSDFDAGVISHEYGHGISIRLAGGPGTAGCLTNQEQMGEGWSDFFALVMTHQPNDLPTDPRGMGTYLTNQDTNGTGIRTWAYSTDINSSPFNYGHIQQLSVPHGVGSVWCAMLWDLYWAFIDEYGYDEDIYEGTGGNNMVMQLVIDGLKLQPCGPGFVDGRDAILLADQLNNEGRNAKLIWDVFARRGLGYSADQGTSGSRSDGSMAFDLPPFLQDELLISKSAVSTSANGEKLAYELMAINLTENTIYDIELVDTLDPGMRLYPSDFDCGTLDDRVWSISLDSLAAGDSFVCVIQPTARFGQTTVNLFLDDIENGEGDWEKTSDVGLVGWNIVSSRANSGSSCWYIQNIDNQNDHSIIHEFFVEGERPVLSFYHWYDTEAGWDGGVVEIFSNNTWVDARPFFAQNGYNSTIQTNQASTISGRRAFSGNSGGFIQSRIDLSSFMNQTIKVRFRFSSDAAASEDGWYIDDVSLDDALLISNTLYVSHAPSKNLKQTVYTLITGEGIELSVEELDLVGLRLMPNPASDHVVLNWDREDVRMIQILDINGQLIEEHVPGRSQELRIDVSSLAAGTYFVRWVGEGAVVNVPLIVQ